MSKDSFWDDIEITGAFFEPLIPIPEDMWRSKLFLKVWTSYMSRYPKDSNFYDWRPMLVHTLMPCSGKNALYASRIAASFIAWLGRNNGFSFATELFKKLNKENTSDSDYHNIKEALAHWGYENSLYCNKNLGRVRALHVFIPLSPSKKNLSAIHFDTVEKIIVWLAEEEGIRYLTEVFRRSERILRRQGRSRFSSLR